MTSTDGRRLMRSAPPAFVLDRRAEELFAARDRYGAAEVLEHVLLARALEGPARS